MPNSHLQAIRLNFTTRTVLVGSLGGAAWIGGLIAGHASIAAVSYNIGAIVVLGVVGRVAVHPAIHPQAEIFEAGHQQGYEQGYRDGHRTARPVVVPIRRDDISNAS